MYYPYFRGKQYELITIRENSDLLAGAGFIPIIEPVKESLNGLKRALDEIIKSSGKAILIVNPHHGDHTEDSAEIEALFEHDLAGADNISPGIILNEDVSIEEIMALVGKHDGREITLIHSGFTQAKNLKEKLGDKTNEIRHVFLEEYCGKLYRKHFHGSERVLIRDGFKKRKNSAHPEVELFSDLHATYIEEGVDGFGDFLIVGNEFSEGGGPAYAVAIHLTYIDQDQDEAMFVFHFKSIRQDSPTDPAGKFAEALDKLINEADRAGSMIFQTGAIEEFRDLYARGHFPGLGYAKKLSMQHHIETMDSYFKSQGE